MPAEHQLAEHFFRHSYARLMAYLIKYFGLPAVDIAEDIVQDTLLEAMEKWSIHGTPEKPEGWLVDVARKKAINFLKRDQHLKRKIIPHLSDQSTLLPEEPEEDNSLSMIFCCCHPDLKQESQVVLALKSLCGLSAREIADALLTNEQTINKRLQRAKQKFRNGTIVFEIPQGQSLDKRIDGVIKTLYLLYTQGYFSPHRDLKIRMDLCFEAIRLARQLDSAFADRPKIKALLALMLLHTSRFESRLDSNGNIITLEEQQRQFWDRELIAEGLSFLQQAAMGSVLSSYHLMAGIAAEHCLAESFEQTNWEAIHLQYELLEKLQPHPLVSFHKYLSLFYMGERQNAISHLIQQGLEPELKENPVYFATLSILFRKMGQRAEVEQYQRLAQQKSRSPIERDFILRQQDLL